MDEQDFWVKAFLSVSGQLVNSNWMRGKKDMKTIRDKADIAAEFADSAVEEAKSRGFLLDPSVDHE